jgi:hypothetical protein
MSMDKLSTEFDSKIANCLVGDTQALSAFSKVNKHCRMVAEPCLCKGFVFKVSEYVPLVQMLLTLVHRKELALHISSIQLLEDGGSSWRRSFRFFVTEQTSLNDDLGPSAKAILGRIYDVTTKMQDSTQARFLIPHWLDYMLQFHSSAFDEVSALS